MVEKTGYFQVVSGDGIAPQSSCNCGCGCMCTCSCTCVCICKCPCGGHDQTGLNNAITGQPITFENIGMTGALRAFAVNESTHQSSGGVTV